MLHSTEIGWNNYVPGKVLKLENEWPLIIFSDYIRKVFMMHAITEYISVVLMFTNYPVEYNNWLLFYNNVFIEKFENLWTDSQVNYEMIYRSFIL